MRTAVDRARAYDGQASYWLLAGAILALGTIIRLLGLDKGIWLDEYLSIDIVSGTYTLQELRTPPLYFLLLDLWLMLGRGEVFARLLSVACGLGTLATIMLWLRPYSTRASLIAGLIAAALPIFLRYSQEIRAYPLLLFATALAFFFASRLILRPSDRLDGWFAGRNGERFAYAGLAASLSIAVATHLVGIMLLPAILIYIIFSTADLRRIAWRRLALTLAVPAALFAYIFLFFLWRIPDRSEWWMPAFSLELAAWVGRFLLGTSSLFRPVEMAAGAHPGLAIALDYAIKAALLGYALCLILFGNWRRTWPFLAAALVFELQLAAYSVWLTPIFWYRTALPGLVPLVGFCGLQTATIRLPRLRGLALAALALLLACFATSWVVVDARTPIERWRQAAALLAAERRPADLIVIYPAYAEGLVRTYAADLPADALLAVELGAEPDQVAAQIDGRLGSLAGEQGAPGVFLVVRTDLGVEQDVSTREGLLAYLAARFGPPAAEHVLGIISIAEYR